MSEMVSLEKAAGMSGPVYLRKLRRKADWGSEATPADLRAADVVKLVFLCDPTPYSLFRVENDEEFQRMIVGLNGGRPSLTIDSDFIAITDIDFIDAGIEPESTPGETRCHFTNLLHYDLKASSNQLLVMCRNLIDANRNVVHLTKAMIKPLPSRGEGRRMLGRCEFQGLYGAEMHISRNGVLGSLWEPGESNLSGRPGPQGKNRCQRGKTGVSSSFSAEGKNRCQFIFFGGVAEVCGIPQPRSAIREVAGEPGLRSTADLCYPMFCFGASSDGVIGMAADLGWKEAEDDVFPGDSGLDQRLGDQA